MLGWLQAFGVLDPGAPVGMAQQFPAGVVRPVGVDPRIVPHVTSYLNRLTQPGGGLAQLAQSARSQWRSQAPDAVEQMAGWVEGALAYHHVVARCGRRWWIRSSMCR